MKLEKILRKGKKILKNSIIYPLAFSSILLGGCKKDQEPEIPPLENNLIILNQDELNNITYYSPTTGVVNFQSQTDYSIGDIILANITAATPNGFLREVTNVSNGGKTVSTSQATLEQAIEDGSQSFQRQLNPYQKGIINSVEGVELKKDEKSFDFSINLNDVVLYDADGNTSTTNDQVVANGYINFNNSFNMDIQIENHKLKYLSFKNIVSDQSQLQVTGNVHSNLDKQITIYQQSFGAFVLGFIGPVPVIVAPELNVDINTSGDVSANVITSLDQDASLETSLIYNSGWSTNKTFTKNFSFTNPTASSSMHLKAGISPELNLFLYGVAGPYAGVEGYLRLNTTLNSSNVSWGMYAGLDANVGIKVNALGKSIVDKEVQILNYEELLGSGSNAGIQTSTMTDSRDGHTYNTVEIGNQWWTSENMDYQTGNAHPYNDGSSTEQVFGLLYSFTESQNACPTGWHLPTQEEWDELFNYVGGTSLAAGKLKTTGTIEDQTGYWYSPNEGATNSFGFNALPGSRGIGPATGTGTLGIDAYFWFSGGIQDGSTQIKMVYTSSATSYSIGSSESSSVRCIKD